MRYEYTEWEPTAELRFAVPPYSTTLAPTLQQKWTRQRIYRVIEVTKVDGIEEEWRDVPRVVV